MSGYTRRGWGQVYPAAVYTRIEIDPAVRASVLRGEGQTHD